MRFALLLTLCALSFQLQARQLSLNEIMTEDEQKSMGLDKASSGERQTLETWISTWTLKVISQAPEYHPGDDLQKWVNSWPLAIAPLQSASQAQIAAQNKELNRRIVKNNGNGATLELADGSVWKIATFDTFKTRLWQRGDEIDWAQSSFDAQNPYRLYNKAMEEVGLATAYAQQLKPPSQTGAKKSQDEAKFAGSIRVSSVSTDGGAVDLEDGTSWKIQPSDHIRASSWKRGDRIKTEPTKYLQYGTLLKNLDSGENIRADKK